MHPYTIILLLLFISCSSCARQKYETFCQTDRCLTCVGQYCVTTCKGINCKQCPTGDCCDGTTCNTCRGSRCCKDLECNQCVQRCLPTCRTAATCHHDCFQECLYEKQPYKQDGVVDNFKFYEPKNVTTVINITNTIDNNNTMVHPLVLNTYRINHYNLTLPQISENVPDKRYNCCDVVHPEVCRDDDADICYTRKHHECSKLCISEHVHVVKVEDETNKCINVKVVPFFYCKNYAVEDCHQCYNCVDDCDDCSARCRSSMLTDENFYNRLYRKN